MIRYIYKQIWIQECEPKTLFLIRYRQLGHFWLFVISYWLLSIIQLPTDSVWWESVTVFHIFLLSNGHYFLPKCCWYFKMYSPLKVKDVEITDCPQDTNRRNLENLLHRLKGFAPVCDWNCKMHTNWNGPILHTGEK